MMLVSHRSYPSLHDSGKFSGAMEIVETARPATWGELENAKATPTLTDAELKNIQQKRFETRKQWAQQIRAVANNPDSLNQLASLMPALSLPTRPLKPVGEEQPCFSLGKGLLRSQIFGIPNQAEIIKKLHFYADRLTSEKDDLNKGERVTIILIRMALNSSSAPTHSLNPVSSVVSRLNKTFYEGETTMVPLAEIRNEHPQSLVKQAYREAARVNFYKDTGLKSLGRHDVWDKVLHPPSKALGRVSWFDNSLENVSVYMFCQNILLIDQKTGAFTIVGLGPTVKQKMTQQSLPKREATRTSEAIKEYTQLLPIFNYPGLDGKQLFNSSRNIAFSQTGYLKDMDEWKKTHELLANIFKPLNTVA